MTIPVPQLTTVTAQNPGILPPEARGEMPANITPMDIANLPDGLLQAVAEKDAYEQYANDPTRKVTSVVGHSIPFVDSFVRGALHDGTKGSGSAKIAKTASTGADWGIFVGIVWLYNKGLDQVYKLFPGAREFKHDHPTVAYVGELATGVGIGHLGVHYFNKWGGNQKVFDEVRNFFDKNYPNLAEKAGNIVRPLADFAEKNKVIMGWASVGVLATLGGIIIKNIYDVYKTKKNADDKFEELKDQRYQVTKELLDKTTQKQSA